MKTVLIAGANSYIGNSFVKWVRCKNLNMTLKVLNVQNSNWKNEDFTGYSTVFFVAGLVHKKEKKSKENEYYEINRDLVYEVALKAKNSNVKQFVFLSTMSVYGINSGFISNTTPLLPSTLYGKSKLEGEKAIMGLHENTFKVVIIRPPMVYGYLCKGNYNSLSKFAKSLPFFPKIDNERSMIHIFNLCQFVAIIIEQNMEGLFHVQNKEYVKIIEMVKVIAETHGKKIRFTTMFNTIIKKLPLSTFEKAFGTLIYDSCLTHGEIDYWEYDLEKSILESELGISLIDSNYNHSKDGLP